MYLIYASSTMFHRFSSLINQLLTQSKEGPNSDKKKDKETRAGKGEQSKQQDHSLPSAVVLHEGC